MTLDYARRNNASFPRARRSSVVALNHKLAHVRNHPHLEPKSNLQRLKHLATDLEYALKRHSEGCDGFNAVVVYEYAIAIAVQGIRLAEEGTSEYPYASTEDSGQLRLFKEEK